MFYPDAKVTVAAGLVLASNIHKTYYGTSVRSVVDGETWHAPYVDYCVDNGIITSNQFSDYSENLTRSEMALILGNALPFDYTSICQGNYSDLTENDACYEIATKFYCAGIVSAEATNIFRADDYISRAETVAMMVSLIFPEYRVPNIENNEKAVADLDGDGVVNVKDVLITLNAVINNIALDNTDVNGDGRVNLLDVLKILKFAVA